MVMSTVSLHPNIGGQRITSYKRAEIRVYESGKPMILNLMEIVCQVASPNNDDCRKIHSTCCYNEYFDNATESCVECPLGSFGLNCEEVCVSGFYGHLCRSQCQCESHHCDSVRGCKQSVYEHNTKPLNDSTVELIAQEAGSTEILQEYVQTSLFVSNPTHITYPREDVPDEKQLDHQDSNPWMPVSFLLIGSLSAIFAFGILFYLRTRKRRKTISKCLALDGNGIQQEPDDEHPANRTLAEEEQSDDYAEIRFSQFNECHTTFRKSSDSACGREGIGIRIGMRKIENFADRDDNDCEYSRMQLRKTQSRVVYETQKLGFLNQDQEAHVSLNPSYATISALTKAKTLPRNCRAGNGYNEQITKCTHDIIRSASESRLFQNVSPNSITSMDVSGVTREIQRDDAMIDESLRPYSLCKL